jgi:hypothetical protein
VDLSYETFKIHKAFKAFFKEAVFSAQDATQQGIRLLKGGRNHTLGISTTKNPS